MPAYLYIVLMTIARNKENIQKKLRRNKVPMTISTNMKAKYFFFTISYEQSSINKGQLANYSASSEYYTMPYRVTIGIVIVG